MDLRRCLEPALFGLFPIRRAASAGPQPAREWKSLAHVIFGKCRVYRNPGARSPVSAIDSPCSLLLRKDGDIVLQQNDDNLKQAVGNWSTVAT